jgi:hypothetical protein
LNPLFEVDNKPVKGSVNSVNCNDYDNLSSATKTVDGNFALPTENWLTLAQWQAGNGYGWDSDSAVGEYSSDCPATSIP